MNYAALFVATIAGCLLCIFALAAVLWMRDVAVPALAAWFSRSEELDVTPLREYEAFRASMERHPAKGDKS